MGGLFVLLFVSSITLSASYPFHASCSITWKFADTCMMVHDKLIAQIQTWKGSDGCKASTPQVNEKCLYKLTSQNATFIAATHETPLKHYIDDLTFKLAGSGSACTVQGYSTSETWYAVLDYGTNYCNLHNLITGSGLDKTSGFEESTSDSICTQFSSQNCDRY